MKSMMASSLILLILFTLIQVPVYAQGISVYVFGENLPFTNSPIVSEGRTLVPLREICNAMGADVVWDAKTKSILLSKDGITNTLFINKKIANKQENGQTQTITLDIAPVIVNNVTYVPLRYISESFNIKVSWNQATQTAYIGEYDIPANGAYAGFMKLMNHKYENDYAVYFKVEQSGNNSSIEIKKIRLKPLDMEQYITVKFADGTSETLKRKDWYEYFRILSESNILSDILQEKYGRLYQEWGLYLGETEIDSLTERYIDKKYLKISSSERYDLRDAELVYEWYNENNLNSKDIIIEYDNFRGSSDPILELLSVAGTIILRDKITNNALIEFSFNDSLKQVTEGNDYYYEARIKDIRIRLRPDGLTGSRYEAEFSGEDLVKQGILK